MTFLLEFVSIGVQSTERKRVMARTRSSENSKRKILSVCVKLFIENGFRKSTNEEILSLAGVTSSTFYNIFKTKDGVILELAKFMFDNQFKITESLFDNEISGAMLYAVETALQLTVTELNDHLREIYVEAYSQPHIAEYIYQKTSSKLYDIFGSYLPEYSVSDFYEIDIGTAGIMRAYMSRPCDKYFSLEKKIERFLRMSLSAYNVPKEEQDEVIDKVLSMDIVPLANESIQMLFESLAIRFNFTLSKDSALTE